KELAMRTAVAVLACLGVVTTARAQAIQVEATPTRIAMVKNGFGLVTAAAAAAGSGAFGLAPLPSASLGSLRLSWPDGRGVRRVRTTQAWVLQDVPPEEIEQVFRSQFGADSEFDAASVAVRRRAHQPVLAFDADAPDDGAPLRLTYLAQGIAWSPSYTLHLTGD